MGLLQYWYRVYVPKFSKDRDSFSSYDLKSELHLQLTFWGSALLGFATLAFHVSTLWHCSFNAPRDTVCYLTLYTWGLYGCLLGLAGLVGIVLHYGYADPEKQEDVDSILLDITSERAHTDSGDELDDISIVQDSDDEEAEDARKNS